MFSVLLILLFLPLISSFGLFLMGKKANQWVGWIATFTTLIGLVVSVVLAKALTNSPQSFVFEWFSLQQKSFTLSLQTDNLALLMLIVVHLVALLVQIFSISYMHDDAGKWRYFAFLGLFIFSMLVIVLAGNLLLMYVGWELVGLSSYLLIGFWYEKPRAVWAAKKAFLLNRIGDAGFLIGILLLFWYFGTTEISVISKPLSVNSSPIMDNGLLITGIGLLLFCGAIGKSAQFPLSSWLPDAMEGPTPVSALIHAATMVAAGIFLLARIHFLLTPEALWVVTIIGAITMLLGAYRAIFQTDIKKLLAYSTISQLGLMVMGMGVGAREASLFHLLTHAFFKAGLFLAAGAVIHAVHSQDMRQMGGLRQKMSVTFVAYTVCAAALAGLPFFSGFLSKDAILVEAFAWAGKSGGIAYSIPAIGLLSAGLTAFYVARQWRMVFLEHNADYKSAVHNEHLHDADNFMKIPMIVLASLSVFIWFSWNPFDASHGWFFNLFPTTPNENLHTLVAILATLIACGGLIAGLKIEVQQSRFSSFLERIYDIYFSNFIRQVSQKISHFDQRVIDTTVNGFGYLTVIVAHLVGRFDRMIVDGIVNGLAWLAGFVGNRTRGLHNGQIQSYFVAMLVGVLFLIFWILS
jgi:NADH-quinone oxidoreductase subunit L